MKQLKAELKHDYKKTNIRLLKMTAVMLILLFVAAVVYGRIQF